MKLPEELIDKSDAGVLTWKDLKNHYGTDKAVRVIKKLNNDNILTIDGDTTTDNIITDNTKFHCIDPMETIILNFIKNKEPAHTNDVKVFVEKMGISPLDVDRILDKYGKPGDGK